MGILAQQREVEKLIAAYQLMALRNFEAVEEDLVVLEEAFA